VKTLVIYFDHEAMTTGEEWDDVVANLVASLPRVISPCKGQSRQSVNEADDEGHAHEDDNSSAHEGDSSSEDSDFEDNDYDLEADDELFANNVDENVTDEGAARGKKIAKGTKRGAAATRSSKMPQGDEQDESTDDDLQLPKSDCEGEPLFKCKTFKAEDLANPVFKVGMKFDSVELLRQAITEYSLRNRVDIKVSFTSLTTLTRSTSELQAYKHTENTHISM
jgi:hypothetical protein